MTNKKFDYHIFIDYSENLAGYIIIEAKEIKNLIKKISRFKHYKGSKNRKVYLKHINKTIKRDNIISHIKKIKICEMRSNLEIYTDVLDFIKKHKKNKIFLSIDDRQYLKFKKLIYSLDGDKVKITKEGSLEKNTDEYKMSLIIDNMLNIKRRQQK